MGYQKLGGNDKIKEFLEAEEKLKIFLDSNVIIAYLDESHKFNYEAKAIIDPLKDGGVNGPCLV